MSDRDQREQEWWSGGTDVEPGDGERDRDVFGFPDYEEYTPAREHRPFRNLLRRIWAPVAAAVAFGVKYGAVVFKLKFFTVLWSMLASAGVYIWIGGVWFGVGLVLLIFVHEMGHVLEAKRQGLPVSAPFFIPLMGAVIQMKRMPQDAWHEALNGIAGPILGSIGAAACWAAGAYYDSRPLIALAFLGFFINLFNLLPAVPLDGGRAVAAIHPALWAAGLAGLLALAVRWHNAILYIIILLGALELWRRWQVRHLPEARAYYRVRPWQRVVVAVTYVGLAVLLVLGMNATHVERDF